MSFFLMKMTFSHTKQGFLNFGQTGLICILPVAFKFDQTAFTKFSNLKINQKIEQIFHILILKISDKKF